MNKEIITSNQGACIIILSISSYGLVQPLGKGTGPDIWIASLLGMAGAFLIFCMYSRILSQYPGKNLFDILGDLFSKPIAKVIIIIYMLYIFNDIVSVVTFYSEYVITVSIPETPMIVIAIFLVALVMWISKYSLEVLGSWSIFFVILNAPIPFIIVLLLIPEMDFSNFMPFLYSGIKPLIAPTASISISSFATNAFLTLFLFSFKTKSEPYKAYLQGLAWGGLLNIGVHLVVMLLLGQELYDVTFYPIHMAATKVSISPLLQRLEVLTILATITAAFVKLTVGFLVLARGLAYIFNFKDYRFFLTPCGLLVVSFTMIIGESTLWGYQSSVSLGLYFIIPFVLIIPLIILIVEEVKKSRC